VALSRDGSYGSGARPSEHEFQRLSGQVAADDAEVILDKPSLYELAKVDWDRYTILAVDLTINGHATATVYAIDRVQHPDPLAREINQRRPNEGEVPVVPFNLPEASAHQFIKHAFSRISVRLVTQPFRGNALVVTKPAQNQGHSGLTKSSLAS
jgi:hypothetical protein